jgi:hypothetical protein
VIVWDTGTYRSLTERDGKTVPVEQAVEDGHVTVWLEGRRLTGGYALTRIGKGRRERWLLVKMDDEEADARRKPVKSQPELVLLDRTIEETAAETEAGEGRMDEGSVIHRFAVEDRSLRLSWFKIGFILDRLEQADDHWKDLRRRRLPSQARERLNALIQRGLTATAHSRAEVVSAAGLVLLPTTDVLGDHLGGRHLGGRHSRVEDRVCAADRADRGQLVHALRQRHQRRQRLKRQPRERHVQTRHHHDHAVAGQPVGHPRQAGVEEVRLIDGDHVGLRPDGPSNVIGGGRHQRGMVQPGVRGDAVGPRAHVEAVGEHLDPPFRDHRPSHPAQQLLGLAGEHRTRDDLHPSSRRRHPFAHVPAKAIGRGCRRPPEAFATRPPG